MEIKNQATFLYGGDYNPEQWPEETWQLDIDKLKTAKINVATINVFSWAILEYAEGKYNFTMLDKIIKLLSDNDIKIILATSTAAMPAWMIKKYPDISRVNTNGIRQKHGKRHNACPNSLNYKRLSLGLVAELAKRYYNLDNMVCWHVSNEYEGYCYCDNCARKFRIWLKSKYKDITNLNQKWNSNFWSHTYYDWDEINPPMKISDLFDNGKPVLSGAALDYQRFQSDSLLNNYCVERDCIKKYDQNHAITTNLMGSKKDLDYFKWAKEMDIVSWDNYPESKEPISNTAMQHDLMRGLKQAPFLLMEQTPNQQNWYPYNALKKPGEMRMLSYQAIAHGASSVQFFQLKQAKSGAEKFHGSVLTHSNSVNTRTFKEVKNLGNELSKLSGSMQHARNIAKVAIVFDWESYWGIENSIGPLENLSYVNEIQRFYKAFYDCGISVDIISQNDNLQDYSVVVAPVLYMMKPSFISEITGFVENGGRFVTSYLSCLADENDNIYSGGYLEPLREVLGIQVDERDARSADEEINILDDCNNEIGTTDGVCDLVVADHADVWAKYSGNIFYDNTPVITKNNYGKGQAIYCGSMIDEKGMYSLVKRICSGTDVIIKQANEVEISIRSTKNENFYFIINTSDSEIKIDNPCISAEVLLSDLKVGKQINLKSFGVVILRESK
ncbi:beta-galactosidase [Paucilactobacillus oligofermentans DSM 15707 = LMG 22743]|uniref:Beta-galactosidase n=1 Tax=Paucilactobacillus oligofermentans DSM 15707 = LMG 22743 TaxID=1423778 RepID=A0A0R1RNU9_9LACO|nr:beta-galactosidase [Paucilactobacillus oligofermentans]KRL55717.1 beta-galactosidase [Paucilactobacillus oligofermentans DSM 15707 = LMG 22743]CUS27066.1 Beta-galactosidase [Paucilactobacillus oligofermentans DSM 15707 = LMG 22743]